MVEWGGMSGIIHYRTERQRKNQKPRKRYVFEKNDRGKEKISKDFIW